jgi:hypothetical protein
VRSDNEPRTGDGVYVEGMDSATGYDSLGLVGDAIVYALRPPKDTEVIGHIGTIHSLSRASRRGMRGYTVVNDFRHYSRGVSFESNLRIGAVEINSPINLETHPTIFTKCIVEA